jgi:hypothetical protein
MKKILFLVLLMIGSFTLAQAANGADHDPSNNKNGKVTVRGCVSKQAGDYILMQENPGNSYELQGNDHIKLSEYLGHRVEVTGHTSPTMATSSDEGDRQGAGSPVTITVKSIKTIAKECESR